MNPDVVSPIADATVIHQRGMQAWERLAEGWPEPSSRFWHPFAEAYARHALAARAHVCCQQLVDTLAPTGVAMTPATSVWIDAAKGELELALRARQQAEERLWREWMIHGARRSRRTLFKRWCARQARRIAALATFSRTAGVQ